MDDLGSIGDLESYINDTSTVLVYCSSGYFQSKNCMRELVSSTVLKKPMIALIELESSHGGLKLGEVHQQLYETSIESFGKWEFADGTPRGQELYDHLFERAPIEWNRIGHFQVTSCLRSGALMRWMPV